MPPVNTAPSGNRCGHNPHKPRLHATRTIRKGKGGLPRILSLAAERAKAWYRHPHKCPMLQQSGRKTRSERREACQIIIESVLTHLDLASLCLGTPTLDNGFVDVDMQTLVRTAGMSQRRCERAIAILKQAGLMEVKQPRRLNEQGDYVGLRAIRVVTALFFDALGLGPMLQRERARASEALRRRAMKANRKLTDLMRHCVQYKQKSTIRLGWFGKDRDGQRDEVVRKWNSLWGEYVLAGMGPPEAQRRTNTKLGLPPNFSSGKLF